MFPKRKWKKTLKFICLLWITAALVAIPLRPLLRVGTHRLLRNLSLMLVWGHEGNYPDINSLTKEDFPVPVTDEFVVAYKLHLKVFFPKVDELENKIGIYTFKGDALLPLQLVAEKEMTLENEWEILVSQLLITMGYLSIGDIRNAYLEALKAHNLAKTATITKDDPKMVTLQNLVDDIHSEVAGIVEVMSAVDDLYSNDFGCFGVFALLAEHPDEDSFTTLDRGIMILETQATQLMFPRDSSEVYAPITFKGIVYNVHSTIMRYWIQYWTDVNGNMYADAQDTGSSWITVEEIIGPTKIAAKKIISSIDAGTKAMFLDNISYVCRIYSINEAGELSADPAVDYIPVCGNSQVIIEGLDWQGFVQDRDLSAPPAEASTGHKYIVKTPGTGAWAGHDNAIAEKTSSSWDFTAAVLDMGLTVYDENIMVSFDGTNWEKVLVWRPEMFNAFTVKPGIKPPTR
ncbi:MAG: DUF2793 domain-containing protein [Candidatus Omnitrophica bacterium]|nr:DUF2793 domain-containing protein [Candidatus Omnitrophota bacterium]